MDRVHNEPFFYANWAQKPIFKRFYQLSFGTTGLHLKFLILIELLIGIFHWKLTKQSKLCVIFGTKFGPN